MTAEKRPSSLYLDLKNLRERFEEVDKEGRGYIDYNGLQVMISSMDEFDPSMVCELMDSLDRDKDGKVTLEDFQTLYTVERDVIKEQQQQQPPALNDTVSPNKPLFHSAANSSSNGHKKLATTTPSPVNLSRLTRVPDSPDLASHARSLRGTVYDPLSPEQSYHQSIETATQQGELILEDTGGIPITYVECSPIASPKPHSFYGDIRKELESLCPTGLVERDHLQKLSNSLGLDALDEKELIQTWEECEGQVTVDFICHLLQEREKFSMISSVSTQTGTKEAWKQESLSLPALNTGSPLVLKDPPKSSTPRKKPSYEEEVDTFAVNDHEANKADSNIDNWTNGANYTFKETPQKRPSSAKEGSRLSRGYSESGLRQQAIMQNALQDKIVQVMSENDSLKANYLRVEEEKKKLIVEGEESIQLLQRKKQDELNEMKEDYNTKLKEMEKSFTVEHQSLQEKTEHEMMSLKERLTKLKNENKKVREDVEYFQSDNAKLVEDLAKMRSEIKEKEARIARLHETFGIQMESPSDTDLERQATHIQDLERDLSDYAQLVDDLRAQITEQKDKIDELNEECETIKMQLIEEKRKRQRRKSSTASSSSTKTSSTQITSNKQRLLPQLAPVTKQKDRRISPAQVEEADATSTAIRAISEGDSSSDEHAVSSASLLEELRLEDSKQLYGQHLETEKSQLEKKCNDLSRNLEAMKEKNRLLESQLHSNEQLTRQLHDDYRSQLTQVKKEREEMESMYAVQMYSMKNDMMTIEGMNQAFKQENMDLHSNLIFAQNNSEQLEDQCEELTDQVHQLKSRIQSLEHESKMMKNETGLAIHDLAKKEDDCRSLQEKVQELENELLHLKTRNNEYLSQIGQLETQVQSLDQEKSDLEESFLKADRQHSNVFSPAKSDQPRGTMSSVGDNSFLYSTSPFPFSPSNRSFTSSTGQSEIVSQMKSQLEDLQRVLVQKGGMDISDTEMTVIQELLELNSTLEENMASQQRMYNSEMDSKERLIKELQTCTSSLKSHFTESCNKMMLQSMESLQTVHESIQALSERVSRLAKKAKRLKSVPAAMETSQKDAYKLHASLEAAGRDENKERIHKLEEIVARQRRELELVNHYLGKAKSLEMQYDREKEEDKRLLQEKEEDLHSKSMEILELKGKVEKFAITSGHVEDLAEEDLDLLRSGLKERVGVSLISEVRGEIERMNNEHRRSTETAEDVIDEMRIELLNLYQYILNASDCPDYRTMIACIKETTDSLKDELSAERVALREKEEELARKVEECEQLYNEHDEEVQAMEQQSKQRENYLTHLIENKDKQVKEMERAQGTKTKLEDALHSSMTSIATLQKEKAILIETIRTLSLQTICTLSRL